MERLTRKCDDALGICRFSLLPDLAESRAGKLSLLAIILAPREGEGDLAQAVFGFQVSSKKVRFRQCPRLTIRAEGGPDLTRPVRYYQALQRGRIVEGMTAEIAAEELTRLARSSQVSVDLCGTERTLRRDEKALLGELLRTWQSR